MKARKIIKRNAPIYALLIQRGAESSKVVVRFDGLTSGTVVACADGLLAIGNSSKDWYRHDNAEIWQYLPDYQEKA